MRGFGISRVILTLPSSICDPQYSGHQKPRDEPDMPVADMGEGNIMLGVLSYIMRIRFVILLLTTSMMGQGSAPAPNTIAGAPPTIIQQKVNNDTNQPEIKARRFPTRHLKPCV